MVWSDPGKQKRIGSAGLCGPIVSVIKKEIRPLLDGLEWSKIKEAR